MRARAVRLRVIGVQERGHGGAGHGHDLQDVGREEVEGGVDGYEGSQGEE